MKKLLLIASLGLLLPVVHADWFSFYAITENDSSGFSQYVGESQLHMEVVLYDEGQVRVLFVNDGKEDCAVARIYFDYSPEISLSLAGIINSDGVYFTDQHTNPNNLPSGKSIQSVFINDLAVGAANPSPKKGINPGESLELILDYDSSYDIIDALANEDLRVGLHVISLGEYSESFVNVIPEPATLPLLLSGTIAMRWLRLKRSRRYKKKNEFIPLPVEDGPDELHWVEIHTGRDRRVLPLTRCEAAIRKVTS